MGKNRDEAIFEEVPCLFSVCGFEGEAIEEDEPFRGTDAAKVFEKGLRPGLVGDCIVNEDIYADQVVLLLGLGHKKSSIGTNAFEMGIQVIECIALGEAYDAFVNFHTSEMAGATKFFFQQFGDAAQAQAEQQNIRKGQFLYLQGMKSLAEVGVEVAKGIDCFIGTKLEPALEEYYMEIWVNRRMDGFQGNFHKITQEPLRLGDTFSGQVFPRGVVPSFLQRAGLW